MHRRQNNNLTQFYLWFTRRALVIFMAMIVCGTATGDESAKREAELRDLQSKIKNAQTQLKSKNSQLNKLEQAIADSEVAIGELAKKIRTLASKTQVIESNIKTLKRETAQINSKIAEQKERLSAQLVELYKRGNPSPVQLLLDSGSPADIDRQLVYLERINRQRIALLNEFKALLAEQQRLEQEQQAEKNRLARTTIALRGREEQLKGKQEKRLLQIEALNIDIASRSSRLSTLEQDRLALQALIEEMTVVLKQQPSETKERLQVQPFESQNFARAKGKLPWPVDSNQRRKERNGMALVAKKGEAVQAIHSGRIVFADWFRGQGLLIIVDHGNRYWSLYGHNESLLKSPGDSVAAGETIATVGNSGGQSKYALYFEIRHKGEPVNPIKWCRS